jgi:hypothetical protein
VPLKDIRFHFIFVGFELFSSAFIDALPTTTGSRFVAPITADRRFGIASERWQLFTKLIESLHKILDLLYCVFALALIVQYRSEIVQSDCKFHAVDFFLDSELGL